MRLMNFNPCPDNVKEKVFSSPAKSGKSVIGRY